VLKFQVMSRFVVRYRGPGKRPQETVDRLEAGGTSILEDSGRMMLVEASEQTLRHALDSADWVVSEERQYSVPDVRKRPGSLPDKHSG
jgi:hypothetical protein